MATPFELFEESMQRVRNLHALHASMESMLTSAVDLSDILRAEIVLSVSAFDFFIHEFTREGMLKIYNRTKARTDNFDKFQLPMSAALSLSTAELENQIRSKHGYLSFQHPDKVSEAIRLVSTVDLWNEVALKMGSTAKSVKSELSLIVERRNKIAHEADIDPSYPGQRWPINRELVEQVMEKLTQIATAIAHSAN